MSVELSQTAPGRKLRVILDLSRPAIGALRSGPSIWDSPDLPVLYPRYLAAIYPTLRATVPYIAAARAACEQRAADSELDAALAEYYAKRIPEELDHDEWLLDDLEGLGYDREQIKTRAPLPSAAALIGAQFYYIERGLPITLLGYMAALEGYPPTDRLLDAAIEATGYPAAAFRMLRKHAHLDIHHKRELDDFMDSLPLSDGDLMLLITYALWCTERVVDLMYDIAAQHPLTILPDPR